VGGDASASVGGVTWIVRPATDRDLPAILDIENGAFSDPWSLRSFRALLDVGHAWFSVITDAAGVVQGYSVLIVTPPEADLANIAVAARARRAGVGQTLLRAVLAEARRRGVRQVYLEVRASNAAAIGLYTRFGFSQVGLRPRYYESPREDALVMCCELHAGERE
jgi:[ribosomal protein S18]-alanine N-acetyltransferase